MILALLLGLQLVANIILIALISRSCSLIKLRLNIHNLPIVIMWIMGLVFAVWLCLAHTYLYFLLGALICILLLATGDYSEGGLSLTVMISLLAIIWWVQIASFVGFATFNQDKFDGQI